jgi:hypothetical protein
VYGDRSTTRERVVARHAVGHPDDQRRECPASTKLCCKDSAQETTYWASGRLSTGRSVEDATSLGWSTAGAPNRVTRHGSRCDQGLLSDGQWAAKVPGSNDPEAHHVSVLNLFHENLVRLASAKIRAQSNGSGRGGYHNGDDSSGGGVLEGTGGRGGSSCINLNRRHVPESASKAELLSRNLDLDSSGSVNC